MTKTDMQYS